ncbi:MAG: amino acid racemase [Acidobacteriota bacterium]|nr:amino acid racemase [Acidobacteriota bacterium]
MKKTIGIIGGMGPGATAYFLGTIIRHTQAAKDQEHVPVLVWSNPGIPPRSEAILRGGRSPLPLLLEAVRILEKGGAGLLVMPCITAHYYAPQIKARAGVPFVDLIEESLGHCRKNMPGLRKAGLIASGGTAAAELFQRLFKGAGIEILMPRPLEQQQIVDAVFGKQGIKAGFTGVSAKRAIRRIACALVRRGAEAVIAGCTEIPLVFGDEDSPVPVIEPMRIGARTCISRAGFRVREEGR